MPKLKNVESQAFYKCDALKKVGDMSSVTSIERWAFHDCENLEDIGELRSVTEIGGAAFYNCPSLTLRVLPNSYAENYAKSHSIKYTYIED